MSTPEQLREMDGLLFRKNIPTSIEGEHLLEAVRSTSDGSDPGEAGWHLLIGLLRNEDAVRPEYVAARHLLGLIDYPTGTDDAVPYTNGATWRQLEKKHPNEFRQSPPKFPLTRTCRLFLAVRGGGYGTHGSLLRENSTRRAELVAKVTDDFIAALEAMARERDVDVEATTDPGVSLDTSVVSEEDATAEVKRLRRHENWLGGVLVLLIAAAIWVLISPDGKNDSAGLGSQRPEPSNKLTSYWRAGWGPDRPTFTVDSAATYPVFNSITDNSVFGDERNFVNVRHAAAEGVWFDDLWADPGDELTMRVYVNNSGGKNPGSDPLQESIQQARVELGLSEGDGEWSVFGTLSAVNAEEVWDGATIHTDPGVEVVMDASTAKVETNAGSRDLPAEAFSPEGALLGYERADGIIRPLYAEAEYISVRLRVIESEAKPDEESTDEESAETEDDKYRGGWGPERKMYSIRKPAEYTVLNAFTDNPAVGDERKFVSVKPLGETDSSYSDVVGARIGDELVVYAYVDNGASDSLGIAAAVHGLTARLYLPGAGTDHSLAVTYAGENAAEVWDGASVITSERSELVYVPGSAEFHTPSAPGGSYKPKDSAFELGDEMLLGHKEQDGLLPVGRLEDGAEIGNGYLTFRVMVEAASD